MVPGSVRVGSYVLVRELARGAMGVVYEAQAPDRGRVALKVLAQVSSPEALARFDRERRLLVELSGAHGFVPLLDAGVQQGRPWIVMQLMAGGSLRDRLRRGCLSVDAAVEVGYQLGMAMGRAHARGIVHRDLKPENVLFERGGDDAPPRIADLGVARHFRREDLDGARSASLSRSGAMLGTACYMSPEQVVDPRRVGPPSDVFALAQIVYECLAGVTPFARESLQETMAALVDGRPDPLRERVPDAPAWLEAVLARALEADPARRFADGQAFARALALRNRTAEAPRRARHGAVGLALGALALAGLGVVVVVVARRGDAPGVAEAPEPRPVDAPAAPVAPGADEPITAPTEPVAEAPSEQQPGAASEAETPQAEEPGPDTRDANAWVKHGGALQRTGQLDGAIEAYRRALELNPRKTTRVILTYALIDAGRADEAVVEAERLVQQGADPASLNARGAALIAARQLRGLADLERVTARDRKWPSPWITLSVGRIRARDYQGALEAAEHVLSLGGQPGLALRSRGLARLALGDDVGAREDLERYRSELDAAAAARDAELQAGLARVGAPTDPAPDANAEATRLVEQVWLARAQRRDMAEGLALMARAAALAPDHAGALAMKGAATRGPQGLALVDRAITLGPAEGWMFLERARHRFTAGDFTGAADDYARAVALDGPRFDVLRLRAQALRLANHPRALEAAQDATRADPSEASGWILLARVHRDRSDAASALGPALRATELAPDDPDAWRELGGAYLLLSRWQDAIAPFERLLALVPDDPGGLTGRGMAVGFAGRTAEGIRDLERAVKARPDDPQTWLALATCHADAGDAAAAHDAAERVLALRPDTTAALRLRALARSELGDLDGARADVAWLREHAADMVARDPKLKALAERLSR